jgi:hypothetical protein
MTKQMPELEWQVCEGDVEWQAAKAATLHATPKVPVHRTGEVQRRRRWVSATLLALLLPLLVAGYRTGYRADQAMDRVEGEVAAAVVAEAWARPPTVQTVSATHAPAPYSATFGKEPRVEVRRVEVRGEYAMVEVWIYASPEPWLSTPYRQTRFYRGTEQGWLPTGPPDIFWQPHARLQVGRFTFVYGPRDASTVLAVAGAIEAMDAAAHTELGLIPSATALTIHVIPPIAPDASLAYLPTPAATTEWDVPSPALLALPPYLSEADALRHLLGSLLARSALQRALALQPPGCAWTYLESGLDQWLAWDQSELPSRTRWYTRQVITGWLAQDTPPRLAMLVAPGEACAQAYVPLTARSPDAIVGTVATVADYAMSTFGRERLPALLDGMNRYDTWEALTPAVFGVSAADFESGWQQHLVKEKR